MSSTDSYREWDAAYVLGALSVVAGPAYEEHLQTCQPCREAVAELAIMPGLLTQVPFSEVADSVIADREPMPPDLLPEVRRLASERTRRRVVLAAVAAAALLLGGFGGILFHAILNPTTPGFAGQPYRIAFSPVVPSSMTAVADVVPVPDGTEIRVECQYGTSPSDWPAGASADYAIYVIDRSDRSVNAKTWTARPQRVMHPVAPTAMPMSQIKAVEIREVATGKTLLRANLS